MAPGLVVSVDKDQERFSTFYWLPKLHKKHISLDLLLIPAHARLPNYRNCYTLALLLSEIILLNSEKMSLKGPVKSCLVNQKFM